jgi:uncharacterized membrane protein
VLVGAVQFWQVVLAIHILAVVAGFGVVFAYPLFVLVGARRDPRAMPWFHRMQQVVGRRLINPALTVVLIAGIYLAADLHQWKSFYVGWGLAAAVVIGALEGAVMIPGEGRLAELAARDVAAAGDGAVTWSPEYEAQVKRIGAFGTLLSLLIVVTVFLMSVQA